MKLFLSTFIYSRNTKKKSIEFVILKKIEVMNVEQGQSKTNEFCGIHSDKVQNEQMIMRIIIYWYRNSIRPQDSKMKSLAINVSFLKLFFLLFYIIKFYLSFVWLCTYYTYTLRRGASFFFSFYIYNNNVPPFYTRTRTHHDNIYRFIVSSIFLHIPHMYKRER